jgi:hypothetical protein
MTAPPDPQPAPDADAAAPAEPPAFATTLGQTPHEPNVRPWELELLISGAVVFALLQLPGQVDTWHERFRPTLAEVGSGGATVLYLYLKLALYTLIGSFLLHLAIRAYWVGMIGLESVFPRGIVWENTQLGPVGREAQRRRVPPIQALIDRADRAASVVFGAGFTVALIFLLSVVLGGIVWALALGISRALLGGEQMSWVLLGLALFFSVPQLVLSQLDRRLRVHPGSRGWRRMDRAYGLFYYMQGTWLYAPAMLTLSSNVGRRKARSVSVVVMYSLVGFALVKDVVVARGGMSADSYLFVPDNPGRVGVEPGYYEDKRGAGKVVALPSIQSDVVRDPYVRLFVPYTPAAHNRLLRRACPGLRPFTEGGVRVEPVRVQPEQPAEAAAVLRCWPRVQPVTLNGRPVTVPLRFYQHPVSGLRGVVAHIPTAGLPRGENVITVARLPSVAEIRGESPRRSIPPHYIPFWL